MRNQRLIVTSPLLRAATVATVQGEPGRPVSVLARRVELSSEPLNVALGARQSGAEVTYLGLAEPQTARLARSDLERHGIATEIIEVNSACLETIDYVDRDGQSRLKVIEPRLPSIPDVDRLLDRLGALVERGAAYVVVASDLEGAETQDFAERAIGRAWGLGVRTITTVNGASLKQSYHCQPAVAFCEESELLRFSPAPEGVQETTPETLRRIFEDSIRLLLMLGKDGIVQAVSRAATVPLGPLSGLRPQELMGGLAAKLIGAGEDYVGAAQAAFAELQQAVDVVPAEAGPAQPMSQAREAGS